uniref:Cell 12A endoglucanase n=1 Tax=Hyaloperonospora arabidopsidis (strain Emoy2) TaxID=559515 RepID=M4BQB0_HYAAE
MKILVPAIPLALVATSSLTAAQRFCGQYDLKVVPPYTVYNNLWGQADDSNGTQCTEVTRISDESIAWTTDFKWAGSRYQVKSFANAALTFTPVKMSQVASMPTVIEYKYESVDDTLITNVAYDMLLSPHPEGEFTYELMVWLATFGGAAPLARSYDPMVPVKANVTVAGVNFNLYEGMNGNVTVLTYLATGSINRFSGNLQDFVEKLPNPKLLDDQYLVKAETGTEPFQGDAKLIVSKFSLEIIQKPSNAS